jgi:hypothetical protein
VANSSVAHNLFTINVSGDGSRAILKYDNTFSPSAIVDYSYDAGTGQFTPAANPIIGSAIQMDRSGSHILSNYTNVYDAALTPLGVIPYYNGGGFNCATQYAVISPDGTRAYSNCAFGGINLYTYDLTAMPVGGYFRTTGSRPLAVSYLPNYMQISEDGNTLFMIYSTQFTVVPLP